MKTMIEIPDPVFRRSKAAAMRGESFKDFVTDSLRARLEANESVEQDSSGWRRVYGQARPEDVAEVDAIVAQEFETVDPDAWR